MNYTTTCHWCGLIHGATCPRIKAIEYHQDGTIKRVEFHPREGITYHSITNPQSHKRDV